MARYEISELEEILSGLEEEVQNKTADRHLISRFESIISRIKRADQIAQTPLKNLRRVVNICMQLFPLIDPDFNLLESDIRKGCQQMQMSLDVCRIYLYIVTGSNKNIEGLLIDEIIEYIISLLKKCINKLNNKKLLENKHIKSILSLLCNLLENLQRLIQLHPLQDCWLVNLVNFITPVIFSTNTMLHIQATDVLAAVFGKYKQLRVSIVEDILNLLPSDFNPSWKFQVSEGENICFTTFLLLQMIQSCCEVDFYDHKNQKLDLEAISKNYEESLVYARYFIQQLLNRCGKADSNEFKNFLDVTLNDTLTILYKPQFPGAIKLLLQIIYHLFSLLQRTETLRYFALERLGNIARKFREDMKNVRNQPLGLHRQKAAPVSDKPHIFPQYSKCICMQGLTLQEPMLSCAECHRWFHSTCIGVDITVLQNSGDE